MRNIRLMPYIVLASALCGASYGQQPTSTSSQESSKHEAGVVSQSAEARKLEEVTVTARRREESQQDVPLSMIAKSGDYLKEAQIDSVDELSRAVPGFSVVDNNNNPVASYFVRGIGTTAFDPGSDSSVGVAMDGAVMPYSTTFGEDYNDIARVEVLRGPQGTLFGKNASAGLLNITTKDPTESFSGTMGVGYGSYNEVKLNGAISGPVVGETLLGRLSFSASERDGYIPDLSAGGKRGDQYQQSLRGVLLYRPTEKSRFRLSYYDVRRDADKLSFSPLPISSFGPLSPPNDVQFFSDIASSTNIAVKTAGVGQFKAPTHFWGSILQWDQQLGDHTLTSITSYVDWQWQQQTCCGYSGTPVALPAYMSNQVYDAELLTQELRIASPSGGRVDYVGGLYLFDETRKASLDLDFSGFFYDIDAPVDTLNYAAFGEANWHLSDQLTLITGARWTHEEKDFVSDAGAPPPGYIGIANSATPGRITDSASVDNLSWRLGLQWSPSGNRMVYATAAQGFKGPGFNALSFSQDSSQRVDPEKALTFEVGAKTSWFDRRLSADLAVFHTEFEDLQVLSAGFVLAPDGTPILDGTGQPLYSFILNNAGSLRSRGVELEVRALPAENLNVTLAGAYVDAEYKEYLGAPCFYGQWLQTDLGCTFTGGLPTQDLSGVPLSTPKLSGNLGASYELKLPALPYNGIIRADYAWRDGIRSSTGDPYAVLPSRGLLSASIGLRGKEGRYSVTLYGKNLTDKFYVTAKGGGFGTVSQFVPPDYQRTYGVRLDASL